MTSPLLGFIVVLSGALATSAAVDGTPRSVQATASQQPAPAPPKQDE
jgi:hypothetical protein